VSPRWRPGRGLLGSSHTRTAVPAVVTIADMEAEKGTRRRTPDGSNARVDAVGDAAEEGT
jgi:hypothetical protein